MGLFDSIKNAIGGGKAEPDTTVAPSQLLREAGIDPAGLKFGFGTGTISVSGTIKDEADRQKILDTLSSIKSISSVEDNMVVEVAPAAPVEPAAVEPAPPTPDPASDVSETVEISEEDETRTYTVKSGDSLWKIAEAMYGNGSNYMKIFEANSDLLENPDKIFPGQELKIPKLDN